MVGHATSVCGRGRKGDTRLLSYRCAEGGPPVELGMPEHCTRSNQEENLPIKINTNYIMQFHRTCSKLVENKRHQG